jgi:hypothetical protein
VQATDVQATDVDVRAAMADMEQAGAIEFSQPTRQYVRATGRWSL